MSESLSVWTPDDTIKGLRSWNIQEGSRHLSMVCADGRFLRGLYPTISVIIYTRPHTICSLVFLHLRTDAPCLSASGRCFRKLPDCSNHTRTTANVVPKRHVERDISQVPAFQVLVWFRRVVFWNVYEFPLHLYSISLNWKCWSSSAEKQQDCCLRNHQIFTNLLMDSESSSFWICAETVLTIELLSVACLNIFPLHMRAAQRSSQMGCLE